MRLKSRLAAIVACSMLAGLATAKADDHAWTRTQLDSTFRAEGVAVGDFNHDGLMDIAAGDVWYAAPDWKVSEVRPVQQYQWNGNYSQCFCSWAYDISGDGWDDIIIVGFPGDPFFWYENPQGKPGHWAKHEIWHSACNETMLFTDITGDGRPEMILGSQPERQMGYLEIPSADKCRDKWKFTAVSEAGDPGSNGTFKYYHGLGAGDVNLDGRIDIMIPHGWWENPAQRDGSLWAFHPWKLAAKTDGSPVPAANLYAIDVDLDGDQDIVGSSAHQHGVWWWENVGNDKPMETHLIDSSVSQTHAMMLCDLYGTGTPTFVTGKRYWAHNGHDPDEKGKVVMLTYELHRKKGEAPQFVRSEITAGEDTGIGTQFVVQDMNKDGKLDIVLSNKKGVNLLIQK